MNLLSCRITDVPIRPLENWMLMGKKQKYPKILPDRPRGGNLLFLRVREQIFRDLVTGNYAPGDRYFTEKELAARLNVCRNTVRKAMAHLEGMGYLSRHKKIGTIVRNISISSDQEETIGANRKTRQRLIVKLPGWNDSTEGFYSGKLLRALSSPDLSPQFAVEIRHYNDPIEEIRFEDPPMVLICPEPRFFSDLQAMALRGGRIIAIEPQHPIPGLINLLSDRHAAVNRSVKNFYELGHRSVGLMNQELGHVDFEQALMGYLDAHDELDIPIPSRGIVQYSHYATLQKKPDVVNISAWVCSYIGAIHILAEQCRRAGVSIPEDVSLISLDDPGDITVPSVGRKISVAGSDTNATAALIHAFVQDWREDRRGTIHPIPTNWIDRETVAPPSPSRRG